MAAAEIFIITIPDYHKKSPWKRFSDYNCQFKEKKSEILYK